MPAAARALSPQLPKSHLELVYVEWSGGGKDGGARVPPRFDIYGRGMEHLDRYLRLKKELLAAVNAARGPSSAP